MLDASASENLSTSFVLPFGRPQAADPFGWSRSDQPFCSQLRAAETCCTPRGAL